MPRPFIPAAGCAQVEMIYNNGLLIAENVFHISKGTDYTFAQLQAVRDIVNNWDATQWQPSRAGIWALTRIRTKGLHSASSPTEDFALPVPRPGSSGGGAVPINSTYCLKKATGLTGRSNRGRWYVVGLTTGSALGDSNTITAAARTFFETKLNLLITQLAAGGHTMVVLSLRTAGAWRATAVTNPVTSFVGVDLNLDSQRRRLPGRGHA